MIYRRLILSLLVAVSMASTAYADIGGIGSPVVPSNTPQAKPKVARQGDTVVVEGEEERKPLLVIRFNQRRVYFERALHQAVQSTEKVKTGATYEIVSYVPTTDGGRGVRNQINSGDAANNVNAVVEQ